MGDGLLGEQRERVVAAEALFAWRGDEIVLLIDRPGEQWVVARGWRSGDRLLHVRRWSFPCPRTLAGQVRRLVREATDDAGRAADVADAVLAWVAQPQSRGFELDLDPASARG